MKRSQLLGAAVLGALGAPSRLYASGRVRGDGFKTIPYIPFDTRPYFAPGPALTRNRARIDPLIWPVVERINKSGWVWTAESCQGGPDHKWSRDPMLRLVCRAVDEEAMLGAVYRAARVGSKYGVGGTRLILDRHSPSPVGWTEVRVFASEDTHSLALDYFARMAKELT